MNAMSSMNVTKRVHTHYDNLKVTRDAPPEVIRAAYRSLCHKFHPDRHGGSAHATHTFQLISRAYAVLSDPQQRRQHDEWIAQQEPDALPAWDGQERRRRAHMTARRLSAGALRWHHRRAGTLLWTSATAVAAVMLMLYAF